MRTEAYFIEHEKFRLIQEISHMLQTAPPPVRRAWHAGWTDIEFFPDGYTSVFSCGCCFTDHPPGWYGYSTKNSLTFICDPHGGKDYVTDSWDILDSH